MAASRTAVLADEGVRVGAERAGQEDAAVAAIWRGVGVGRGRTGANIDVAQQRAGQVVGAVGGAARAHGDGAVDGRRRGAGAADDGGVDGLVVLACAAPGRRRCARASRRIASHCIAVKYDSFGLTGGARQEHAGHDCGLLVLDPRCEAPGTCQCNKISGRKAETETIYRRRVAGRQAGAQCPGPARRGRSRWM